MQRSEPFASAGLSRLDASIVPPLVLPAPMMVWISSMNKMACGIFSSCFKTDLTRASKSPRYFVPAKSEPISSAYTSASFSTSGISPLTIWCAKPSASAVLPTPASPTKSGLFLRRRHRICTSLSISCLRPIKGSIRPALTSALRLTV